MSLQARKTKATTNKWDYNELEVFCTVKEVIIKTKRQPINGRRHLQMIHPIREDWLNGYKKQDPYICCLQETHLKTGDTYRLKVKGWKKDFPCK